MLYKRVSLFAKESLAKYDDWEKKSRLLREYCEICAKTAFTFFSVPFYTSMRHIWLFLLKNYPPICKTVLNILKRKTNFKMYNLKSLRFPM